MKEYLEKYRSRIALIGVFVFLIHGAKLNSAIIGIDTEDLIHIRGDFYGGWLNTGRQGLIALKWLMDSLGFNPYLAGLLTVLFFGLAVSAFFLLWDRMLPLKCRKGMIAWAAGGMFLIAHPVLTEQFYFTLQSVEICLGMLLTAAALYLVTRYREIGGRWRLAGSILILLLTFSVYQAFVVLFIFGTVSVLLPEAIAVLAREGQKEEKVSAGMLLKGIVPYLGVFLVAFCINTLITTIFFSASDYLGGQIIWGKFAWLDNLRAIAGHVVKVLTGYQSLHYHFTFGLLSVIVFCLVIMKMTGGVKGRNSAVTSDKNPRERSMAEPYEKRGGAVAVILFYFAALLLTPFLMTLICGGAPAVRSQLVLPFVTGYLAYLAVSLLPSEDIREKINCKIVTLLVALVCVAGIFSETATTMSLYYTDRMRYDQDVSLGRELITEIERAAGGEELPVAVIGRKPFSGNHACVLGEIIGKSFFDHDVEVDPQYYWSTRRALGFLHTLGADYKQVGIEQFGNAVQEAADMPVWPAEESVQVRDGMVLIKLSEPGRE